MLLVLWSAASAQALTTRYNTPLANVSVSTPDIALDPGTDGTAYHISTNKTWAQMNVTAVSSNYYANSISSDVDSNGDTGTHSNFTAQQYGPDSVYDTITEMQDPSSVWNYYPSSYTMTSLTSPVSGTLSNLQSDDSQYMQFRSWASATTATTMYSHNEQTSISGTNYYQFKLISADATGQTLTASMGSATRTNFGKLVYPLTGVNTINASTWTAYYRAWKDADQTIVYDTTTTRVQSTSQNYISWTHTVAAGNNRILVVTISAYNSAGTPVTCSGATYNGVTMTQQVTNVYTTNPQVRSYIFTLTSPPTGSAYTIRGNFSAGTVSVGGAVSYRGVDQTTPIQTTNSAIGSGISPSVSLTVSGSGRAVYGSLAGYRTASAWTITDAGGQTHRWGQTGQLYKGHGDDKLNVSPGAVSISWTLNNAASYVALEVAINPATPAAGHCDVDIIIRQSDGTVRSTIATNVATSGATTTSASTLSGTYAWSSYSVVLDSDYLELDFYVDTTTACAGTNANLRIDDNTLAISSQTRLDNIFLPSQFTAEIVFEGTSNANAWTSLNWTINSKCSVAGVTATSQIYNFSSGSYPLSGDGYNQTTMGTSDATQTQLITTNPTNYRNGTNWFRIRINVQLTTTSRFDWYGDLVLLNPIVTNYILDLEEKWTNVDYSQANEQLCIYCGAMGTENLTVDVWTGSSWQNVFASLVPGWDNVSISSSLNSSTFTARFRGSNETNDSVQDNWQIDAALIHVWTDYFQNVLNIANQNATAGYQARLEIASMTGISSLSNFTGFLHDGTTSKQVEILNGVIAQSSGSWYTLAPSSSIYISLAVKWNTSGACIANLKLHIVKNGTVSPEFVQTIMVNVN